jgi:hypothetical protein
MHHPASLEILVLAMKLYVLHIRIGSLPKAHLNNHCNGVRPVGGLYGAHFTSLRIIS